MKCWKLALLLLLGILAYTPNTKAQGTMEPDYSFSQILYWLPTPSAATEVEVGIYVSGNTICYPLCPMGVTHHYDLVAGLGTTGGECVGADVEPETEMGNVCTLTYNLPFWDVHGSVYGTIICSRIGVFASDAGGIADEYWETQVAFVSAVPNSANVTNDCTYPNDTSPDWSGIATNPYGTQGSSPSPAIIEEMRLAYTPSPSGYGTFEPFPNGYDGFTGPAAVNYGPWSGSMPQRCTQHGPGKTVFTPGWLVNP